MPVDGLILSLLYKYTINKGLVRRKAGTTEDRRGAGAQASSPRTLRPPCSRGSQALQEQALPGPWMTEEHAWGLSLQLWSQWATACQVRGVWKSEAILAVALGENTRISHEAFRPAMSFQSPTQTKLDTRLLGEVFTGPRFISTNEARRENLNSKPVQSITSTRVTLVVSRDEHR